MMASKNAVSDVYSFYRVIAELLQNCCSIDLRSLLQNKCSVCVATKQVHKVFVIAIEIAKTSPIYTVNFPHQFPPVLEFS